MKKIITNMGAKKDPTALYITYPGSELNIKIMTNMGAKKDPTALYITYPGSELNTNIQCEY